MKIKNLIKKLFYLFFALFLIVLSIIFIANTTINRNSKGKVFDSLENIPHNKVGVVLGTAKFLKSGSINPYYQHRINATVALFKAGKIDYVLVSGDNKHISYNEPITFKNDLIALGIPENKIYLDYAGFRTLDSMVRAKEVFGQSQFTVISQQFHNQRAIYLAEKHGISAVGFNAKDLARNQGLRVKAREYLARVKVFKDLIFNKQPHFLGELIIIGQPKKIEENTNQEKTNND